MFIVARDQQEYLKPDEDFRRSITGDELKKIMRDAIHKFFCNQMNVIFFTGGI